MFSWFLDSNITKAYKYKKIIKLDVLFVNIIFIYYLKIIFHFSSILVTKKLVFPKSYLIGLKVLFVKAHSGSLNYSMNS